MKITHFNRVVNPLALYALLSPSLVVGQVQEGDAAALLQRGIDAIGGSGNLSNVRTIQYVGGGTMRSRSLYMAVSLDAADQVSVSSGRQNISFSQDQAHVKQRIDRDLTLGTLLTFARANLEPMRYSLTVEGGDRGFAANVGGSYSIFAPTASPSGYQDGLLASFLISEAYKWSPLLLNTILSNENFTMRQETAPTGVELPAVYDNELGLAVLFDEETNLPYIIRSFEDHPIFGPSTNDLFVMDYLEVEGVKFPTQFKTFYNGEHLLNNYIAEEVLVNVDLGAAFFDPPQGDRPALARDNEYTFGEIGQLNAVWLWLGPYAGTLDILDATQPYDDLPGVWDLRVDNPLGNRQLVVEVGESVIVLDAPPHQSHLIIAWVEQRLAKKVTHVFLTHHHHDHALGVKDYVAVGAKVIVPAHARSHYTEIPDSQFITYGPEEPFTMQDDKVRVSFVDMKGSVLTSDAAYGYITPTCPSANSTAVVFDADHALLSSLPSFDQGTLHKLLVTLARDQVARNAEFRPSHGPAGNISQLLDFAGYKYPNYSPRDFKYADASC